MKNKTFDPRLRQGDAEFQKSLFKILFSSPKKKHKRSLTIREVFYEAVNFRWEQFDYEFF